MTTLNIPPLNLAEARSVEEALIAHFGLDGEVSGDPSRGPGQLDNGRHEISPDNDSYCAQLLIGQFILLRHGYGRYAGAFYTRRKACPGVGGPR